MALRRLHLLYGVLCSIGGNPLIFMGEEWAVLNDYTYLDDPDKADDSRWIHRPKADWDLFANEVEPEGTLRHRHFEGMRELFRERKRQPALRGAVMRLLPGENDHVLAYLREHASHRLAVLANFSETEQVVDLRGWRAGRPGPLLQGCVVRPDGFHQRHRRTGPLRTPLAAGGLTRLSLFEAKKHHFAGVSSSGLHYIWICEG